MNLVAKKNDNSEPKIIKDEEIFVRFYRSMNQLHEQAGNKAVDRNNRKAVQLLRDARLESNDQQQLLDKFISGDIDLDEFQKDDTYKGLIKTLSTKFGSTMFRFENVLFGLCVRNSHRQDVEFRAKIL